MASSDVRLAKYPVRQAKLTMSGILMERCNKRGCHGPFIVALYS
jgi:hypothetical protein